MADQKLTERGSLSTSNDSDLIHVVQSNESYKQEKSDFLKEDRVRLDNLEAFSGTTNVLESIKKAKSYEGESKVCMFGIDSLTSGAGGENYREFFTPKWHGAFNSAEIGYVHFDNFTSSDLGFNFNKSAGLNYMLSAVDFSVAPIKYSLCGKGLYGTSMVDDNFTWDVNKHFDTVTFYYLQQPSAGTFKYGFVSDNDTLSIPVDTNGALSIQKIEVTRESYQGTGIKFIEINGDVSFFGAWFKIGDNSASVCDISRGGMTLEKQLQLDSPSRQYWYGEILPSTLILNAGTNDRTTVLPADFETDLTNYITDVQTASPNTKVIIVEPNQTSDYVSSYADEYTVKRQDVATAKGCERLDIPAIIGDYDYFVDNSLMLDTIHPNRAGFELIAGKTYNFLGISNYGNHLDVVGDLFSGGAIPNEWTKFDIYPKQLAQPLSATTYTLYDLGFINGTVGFYFDLNVYLRLELSGNMRLKNLKFYIANGVIINNATEVSPIDVTNTFSYTTGTTPDATFSLSIVNDRALLQITPSNNLESVTVAGVIQISETQNAEQVIYYN